MGRSFLAEYLKVDSKYKNKININPEERAKLSIVLMFIDNLRLLIQLFFKYIEFQEPVFIFFQRF